VTYQSINDPKHWRGRAEEMRVLADEMKDIESRSIILRLASDYDRLADRTEERAKVLVPVASPIRE